ncbi:Dehydrogenase RED2 [Colletotrichum sp. SAR11_59]|nr:Dehydrogenase RED2 [Colletotrichum sp. SAR11_59]
MGLLQPTLDRLRAADLAVITRQILQSRSFRKPLGILAAFSLIYTLNKALARWYLRTSSPWDWSKEVVLVTGGSSGIGALLVRNLSALDIKVVTVDIQPPLSPLPPNACFYQLDVTSPAAVRSVAQRIREDLGGDPTVLVNNAGVGTGKPLLAETDEQVRRTFDVNIVAQFWMVREFLPAMVKADHGHVVTVASMASFLTLASNVGYSCSKAAALSLHEGLTQELRYRYNASNVCTSIIHPMFTRTPLIQLATVKGDFPADLLDPEDVADAITKHILRGRSGSTVKTDLTSRPSFPTDRPGPGPVAVPSELEVYGTASTYILPPIGLEFDLFNSVEKAW